MPEITLNDVDDDLIDTTIVNQSNFNEFDLISKPKVTSFSSGKIVLYLEKFGSVPPRIEPSSDLFRQTHTHTFTIPFDHPSALLKSLIFV